MLEKIKAWCFRSATMAWSYFLALAGVLLVVKDAFSGLGLDDAIAGILPPAWVGWYTLALAVITGAARLRSLLSKTDA